MTIFKNFPNVIGIVFFTLFSVLSTFGAGALDTSFNAGVFFQPSGNVNTSAVQPDGKILIGGNYSVINAQYRRGLVRLNTDGTIDTSFNPPEFSDIFPNITAVNAIVLQPNGKIIVAGLFRSLNPSSIVRLNSDGSLDSSFNLPTNGNFNGSINDVAILPDERILIGGNFSFTAATTNSVRVNIARLNSNGTNDETFTPATNYVAVNDVEVQPDGKVLGVATDAGDGSSRSLRRLNSDGTQDASFIALVTGSLNSVKVLPDSKILIGGEFSNVNNFARPRLARLNSNGTLDETFSVINTGGFPVFDIYLLSNGQILLTGSFSTFNSQSRFFIVRLESNGALDLTFNFNRQLGNLLYNSVNTISVLPNGKYTIGGFGFRLNSNSSGGLINKLNADGTYDTSFSALTGGNAVVQKFVQQPDGKILTAGVFGAANSFVRPSIARFNLDGTVDTSFNPTGFTGNVDPTILAVALQPDNKIIVGGQFVGMIHRLNTDGTRDTTFNVSLETSGVIYDVIVLPDGKILAVGNVQILSSGQTQRVVRFNADGTVDSSFQFSFPNALVRKVIAAPDGKLYIGGDFTSVGGNIRNRVARLNADGSIDNSFNPLGGANNIVNTMALQPDGKIIIGGSFTIVNGNSQPVIARLNPDGSLDTSLFPAANSTIIALVLQTDGKILIGGNFNAINGVPRNRIARLNSNGSLDFSFNVGIGADNAVLAITIQSDSNILIGGAFSRYNNVRKFGMARLLANSSPPKVLFDYDADGRADISVFRPSENRWYIYRSSDGGVTQQTFAISGDIPVPADFDGDNKTDMAIFRPSLGDWWSLSSINNAQVFAHWGANGDIPRPSDFDGDGRADYIVFRAAENNWYRISSATGISSTRLFGAAGDKPVTGDFDGDGKSDVAIYRPSTGEWWWQSSIDNIQRATRWGISSDIPAAADFDGDGKTDFAVYRPGTGVWYIINSSTGSFTIINFGISEDKPVAADYDGDGRADIAVFRPSTGIWYLLRSTSGFAALQFGVSSDIPTPNAFVP